MSKKIRCAVIGVGYLGKFHAQKYAKLPNAELIAVVDPNMEQATAIAKENRTQAMSDYKDLVGLVDAVSIAAPTKFHFEIARFCLEHGIHTLIEKPMTVTVEEADELIAIAHKNNALIQVGHLERFNPVIIGISDILKQPLFIESNRIAPFNLRGSDVNVILDVMIHDIDLISYLVKSPIKSIAANGAPVLSKDIDIANARIEFESGCVANVTASRAGLKIERSMRIFQSDAYLSLNLQDKTCSVYRKGKGQMFPSILGIPDIKREKLSFPQGDAIQAEIGAFLDSITNKTPTLVSGEDGKIALETAQRITETLTKANQHAHF